MGIVTTEREQDCGVAASRLFKAMAFDFGSVLPKALPNIVKSAEIEGDGGPGSIKKLILAQGYVHQKVDVVDAENYDYHYTVVEGGVLSETLEKVCYEYKLVPRLDVGCNIKCRVKYYTKGDAQLTQDFLKANNEISVAFTKAVVDYLLANPHD